MKKNNKKGFTLVELIVVSTIMVMIMGAILNWIRPMNKFYDRTQALSDSNDIGSMLMNKVDDELRYATNVVILQDYTGVPKLIGGYLVDGYGNSSFNAKFTDVLIIDNDAVRGSQFEGYDANSNASHRKQARGCIIKADVDASSGSIDLAGMSCLGSEALYNDYGCHFDASLKTLENGNSKCVTIDMALSRPRAQGGTYVFDKVSYNQSRDFELVNINLKDAASRGMKSAFYSSRAGSDYPIDYNTFDTAVDFGKLTGTYTYILYTKQVPVTKNVTVKLFDNKTDTTVRFTSAPFVSGNPIPSETIDQWIAYGKGNQKIVNQGGGKYTKHLFLGIKCKTGTNDIEYYRTAGVASNLEFYCEYDDVDMESPTQFFYFRDRFNDQGEDKSPDWGTVQTAGFWPEGSNDIADGTVNYIGTGKGDGPGGAYTFIGWNVSDPPLGDYSDDPAKAIANGWFVDGEKYTIPMEYIAIYDVKPTAKFEFSLTDGGETNSYNLRIDQDSDIKNNSLVQNMEQEARDNAPDDQVFSHFELYNGDEPLGDLYTYNLTHLDEGGNYSIKPVYKDNTRSGTYEVTIRIDEDLPLYQWNALVIKPAEQNTPPCHIVLTEEDGVTEIINDVTWHTQKQDIVYKGKTFKLYVYDDGYQNLEVQIGNFKGVKVNGDCTLSFDGSTLK